MTRRLLAIWTLISLVLGVLYVPPTPYLVCRMSGLVMMPIPLAQKGDDHQCCRVKSVQGHVALAHASCCDVVQTPDRQVSPVLLVTPDHHTDAVLPLVASVSYPGFVDFLPFTFVIAEAPARAPPQARCPARAPPVFS